MDYSLITERIQKFKETGDSQYIYKNELDKACFQHDMDYGDSKDLTRRTGSDKIFRDKAFNIAKNLNYGYQRAFSSMVYKFFDEITSGGAAMLAQSETLATRATQNKSAVKNENMSNKAAELHKSIIRKFKERKVHSSFIDIIWGADLANMQLISKLNKGIGYVLLIFLVNTHGSFL